MKKYHPFSERVVDLLVKKVNNDNRHYFRLLVGYYLSKIASMMRCNIQTKDRGVVPVNTYILNLMVSGAGKGYSTNIMEREFVSQFKDSFLSTLFPRMAEENIETLAADKAKVRVNSGQSVISLAEEFDIQKQKFTKQFERLGELAFSFDSATTPAIKQMREKLLLAGAGSMNLELDEIGSNLTANAEALTAFLELYDIGMIKQKLIKNTADSVRSEELSGNTPTNLMMFGTPSKLLDGGKTEEEFRQFLETGYARRLLFGYMTSSARPKHFSAEDRFKQMVNHSIEQDMEDIQQVFRSFAMRSFNPILSLSEDNSIYLINYQMECENQADEYKDHMVVHKAEMIHRYYKALKLAGAYAFADNVSEITKDHLDYAISVVEDSGENFHLMLKKRGSYERLANYLADIGKEVTHTEMIEDLPFFKGSEQQRKDMLTLATAYGYKNNIIIKKKEIDNIQFYSGETLKETDLSKLRFGISKDIAYDYVSEYPPFSKLWKLTTATGYHYTNHHFINGHRKNDNAIPGFNTVILDCDGDISISAVKMLMEDYTYLISTTKRHTPELNRFRLILPITHEIKLNSEEYSRYMQNIFEWLPFPVDEAAKDIARKWESYNGEYFYNDGEILDATLFIPETKKSDEVKKTLSQDGVSNIERWFKENTQKGNRATHLYRYGMVLLDAGLSLGEIIEKLEIFNKSLNVPLPEDQLRNSTIKSISKEFRKRS